MTSYRPTVKSAPPTRPVVFSAHSVLAVDKGDKVITRRVVVPQPVLDTRTGPSAFGTKCWLWHCPRLDAGYCHTGEDALQRLMASVSLWGPVGRVLWVRETWGVEHEHADLPDEQQLEHARHQNLPWCSVRYKATDKVFADVRRWRSPRFMPRWASRRSVVVEAIRSERLQSITDRDVAAEGVLPARIHQKHAGRTGRGPFIDAFAHGWDKLNGKRSGGAYAWDKNPWVDVITFAKAPNGTR
jgi:hypothetical protein